MSLLDKIQLEHMENEVKLADYTKMDAHVSIDDNGPYRDFKISGNDFIFRKTISRNSPMSGNDIFNVYAKDEITDIGFGVIDGVLHIHFNTANGFVSIGFGQNSVTDLFDKIEDFRLDLSSYMVRNGLPHDDLTLWAMRVGLIPDDDE